MNKIKINGVEFNIETLKAATWIEEHRKSIIIIEEDEDGCLVGRDAACEGEGMWQAQTCESVKSRDGRLYSICMVDTEYGSGCSVCPAADGPACADHNSSYEIEDDDGYEHRVGEVAEALNLDLDADNCLPDVNDYEAAAKGYVDKHQGARYFVDTCRGFANEWELHILTGDSDQDEDWEACSNPVSYLKDAIMDAKTYHSEYLAVKCVGAVEE